MKWTEVKIKIHCTNKKKIVAIENLLDTINFSGIESKDRLILQQLIDKEKIKESISYDGNSIISYNRIIDEYKKILKTNKFISMSDYFYKFLHLDCGSIAHYDKQGWLHEYNNLDKLKKFFNKNEYGENILKYQPSWKTDVIKISEDILKLTNNEEIKTNSIKKIKSECKLKKDINQLNFFSMIA